MLPPGVDRGVWDYVRSTELVRGYDDSIEGSSLADVDVRYCERWFERPGRLLDLGCGTGRLLVPFAAKGFDCVGVDLSDDMLAATRRKVPSALLVRSNLVELDGLATGCFDYAACLFSTLGMVRGREHRRAVLRHVRRVLKPSGRFVLHAHNRWFSGWSGVRKQARRDLWRTFLGRADAGDREGRIPGAGAPVTLHHFTRREIVGDLTDVGFHIDDVTPVGIDGLLVSRRWTTWRAYGYLIAATSP